MITEFGGAVAVPSAVRSSDSTTTIRVNDVIMIRIDGAIDSTVNSAISWIARSVTPPLPWPRLMLISCANAGPASDPAAIRMAKNKTLRGKDADLTKESSDGPAGTPSRLRDSQSRSSATARRPAEPSVARCAGGAARRRFGCDRRRADPRFGAASPAGRRSAASSRCAISARFWSAADSERRGGGGGGGGGAARRARRESAAALRRLARARRPRDHRLVRARRYPRRHRFAAQFGARFRRAGTASGCRAVPARSLSRIARSLRSLRRSGSAGARAAHFVGKRGPRRPRRRLGHLRFGMIEDIGAATASPSIQLPASGSGAIRGGGSAPPTAAAAASDPVPAWRGRYWVPRRYRSDRRSSADVRRCRAAPAPAAGGHPRRRHRSRPAAASGRDWCWRRGDCRRIGEPARPRAPISARTATNAKKNVSACMLVPGK